MKKLITIKQDKKGYSYYDSKDYTSKEVTRARVKMLRNLPTDNFIFKAF